jgi:hypothetical protein
MQNESTKEVHPAQAQLTEQQALKVRQCEFKCLVVRVSSSASSLLHLLTCLQTYW